MFDMFFPSSDLLLNVIIIEHSNELDLYLIPRMSGMKFIESLIGLRTGVLSYSIKYLFLYLFGCV